MSEIINIRGEYNKARKWLSDTMFSDETRENKNNQEAKTQSTVTYAEVVRELLNQIDNGCDIIPITASFGYESLIEWIKNNAVGNKVIIVKDSLKHTTGQVLAVVFAQDETVLISPKNPKACFVYNELNPTINDLFPEGSKVFTKKISIR